MYYGYCHQSRQYRMMDLPDYLSNTQQGVNNMMGNACKQAMTAYDVIVPGYQGSHGSGDEMLLHYRNGDCGCGCGGKHRGCNCHCECCVNDADVLVHARCGELRRIPLTFENETRRDKPVTLELSKFLSHGGKDLNWAAALTETEFTLRPCDEHTVSLRVGIRCGTDDVTPTDPKNPNQPTTNIPGTTANPATGEKAQAAPLNRDISSLDLSAIDQRLGNVDKCVVGYATIRAAGAATRPIVVAVAVLPEDCDTFRHPCGCGCCH
jgi:hypothetical protein